METLKKTISSLKNSCITDKKFIYLLLIFFVFLFIYWGRFGDFIVDCGREAYIPYAMADLNKVLFKDIICIYGPVPYYLNAVIVKLFGASLNTMYFIGVFLSCIFLFGLYDFAKCFLKEYLTFIYSLIILFVCILNPSISNYIFPYSYAIVYALVFAVFHLIFMFKFVTSAERSDSRAPKYLCISAFFISLCLLSKLDFLPCILPLLLITFKYRKTLDFKAFIRVLISFLIPFFIVVFILIFQKVSLQNLIFNFKMISNMAHSPSLEYFYTVCTGYFFDFKKTFMFVPQFLSLSLILLIAGISGYFVSKINNNLFKIFAYFLIGFTTLALFFRFELVRYTFLYLPLLVFIFFILKCIIFAFKKFKKPMLAVSGDDTIMYFFILFSILFSLKTLFGLFHELYGVFYLPFILLSFMISVVLIFKHHKIIIGHVFEKVGIIIIFLFSIQNFLLFFGEKTAPVKTPAGIIYTENFSANAYNRAFDFLQKSVKPDETILVLPEGLIYNFILKKESLFFNTSFTPLDFDAYGDKYLARELLLYKPKYIIWVLRSYEDYGKTFLCKDFGQKFCKVLYENYKLNPLYDEETSAFLNHRIVRIFERKDDE